MDAPVFKHIKAFFHPYLLPLKALFFFQLGAQSSIVPYIPLFIQHLGLKASENGLLFGSLPFFALLSKPLTGALSDKLKAPYGLIRLFSLVQLVFCLSIFFIPRLSSDPSPIAGLFDSFDCRNFSAAWNTTSSLSSPANLTCLTTDGGTNTSQQFSIVSGDLPTLVHNLSPNLTCSCVAPVTTEESAPDDGVIRWTMQFWLTGLLLIIGWWGYAAVVTLDDSVAFGIVNASPVSTTYGANRVLGTMGWALFALTVGFLMDQFSNSSASSDRDFTPAFATFGVAAVLGLGMTFFLPKQKPPESKKLLVSIGRTLLNLDVLLFCYGAFVAGINSGLLYGYLAWYQSELGATNLLLGITVFVQACYEAPMMAISGWIIEKVGYHVCMLMCLLTFGIRFLGYGLIWNPWFVLLIDVVHSVGFGLYYAALTNFAYDKAPPGGTATLQGILGATYEGFGQGIGGIAAGFLYQQFGGRSTWLGYCAFSFGASVLYGIGGIFLWRSSQESVNLVGERDLQL